MLCYIRSVNYPHPLTKIVRVMTTKFFPNVCGTMDTTEKRRGEGNGSCAGIFVKSFPIYNEQKIKQRRKLCPS